ncbi:MAG TPA: response regulator [Pyrinomonadaceae bacterium]|nr:response regulator [Pyrinomonadaceae bacterium]
MKRSILYLDDEAVCLEVFQKLFGGEYDVRTATTPSDARRMLEERPADIIISDQNMPEISGTEFLTEMAKKYPQSCRVMLTGRMLAGEAIPEILSGIVQLFMPKPWIEEDMRRVLERASLQVDLNSLRNV